MSFRLSGYLVLHKTNFLYLQIVPVNYFLDIFGDFLKFYISILNRHDFSQIGNARVSISFNPYIDVSDFFVQSIDFQKDLFVIVWRFLVVVFLPSFHIAIHPCVFSHQIRTLLLKFQNVSVLLFSLDIHVQCLNLNNIDKSFELLFFVSVLFTDLVDLGIDSSEQIWLSLVIHFEQYKLQIK